MSGLFTYILQRLLASVVTLLGVAVIVFLLVQMLPGDPARVIAGLQASQAEVDRIRTSLALDEPVLVQFGLFFGRLSQGDLGISARTRRPVMDEIRARLPATLKLAVASTLLGTILGIMAGVIAAVRRHSRVDHIVSMIAVTGISMPVYWLGLLLIMLFSVNLRWLPAAGAEHPSSIVLPAITLAAFTVALVARMTRGSMLEVLGHDYVRTARAKGVAERLITYRHALRNAFIPILTVIGLQFGNLLGGSVLTESVFGWPGIGRLLIDSIFARDFPMVQGIVLIYSVMFILINLTVDVLYAYIDPRIQY